MIPLKDDNPTSRPVVVTITLIVLNVVVFLLQVMDQSPVEMSMIVQYGFRPYELIHGVELSPYAPAPSLLTVFSSMFLHGGLLHLGGNMLYLWIFGNNIEDKLGHIRFLLFYLICGVFATLCYVLFNPDSQIPLVGASGAISGVLGAYLVRFPRARVLTLIPIFYFIRLIWVPAYFILGFWFIIQLLPAMSQIGNETGGGVAYMAHVGGFVAGIIGAFLFPQLRRSFRRA